MALLSCQAVAQSEFCQELVKKEPEFYGKTKRCGAEDFCADHMTQELDSLKMCGRGFLEGTGETISGAIDLLKGAWTNIEKQNKLIAVCNQSIECKREMAKDIPKFQKLSDEQLNKFSTAALKVELDNFTYNQSVIARQSVKTRTLSERAEEAELRQSSLPMNSEGTEKRMLSGIKQWLKNKGARLECLDSKTQAEMICWGAAAIIDPLVVAGAAAKGGKIASYIQKLGTSSESKLGIMQSASRSKLENKSAKGVDAKLREQAAIKDAEIRARTRPAAVDAIALKRHVSGVWNNPKTTVENKIRDTFEEYIAFRKNELTREKKELADKALSDIKRPKESNEAAYYPSDGRIRIGDAIGDDMLSYYQVVVHEFEHLSQLGIARRPPMVERMTEALTSFMKKSSGMESRLVNEAEAIGAQWDFLQSIPASVRKQSMDNIRASQAMSKKMKAALISDLQHASLSREDFVSVSTKAHGYTAYESLKLDHEMKVTMRNAAIFVTAVGAAGVAESYYNK